MRSNFFLLIVLAVILAACQTPIEPTQTVELASGSTYVLEAKPVSQPYRGMYAYNGQIPGPLLRAEKGSNVTIQFTNNLNIPTTVHWHGIRSDNAFDGVPGVTQEPVKPGDTFTYELTFPDEGIYWYHPHVREEMQQERGLYGAILVDTDVDEVIFLDDISLDGNTLMPFYEKVTHALMGRFGNEMFINGKQSYEKSFTQERPLRVAFINAANTRTFNVRVDGATMSLLGTDLGYTQTPQQAEGVILGPGDRSIVDISFPQKGTYALVHNTPEKTVQLGSIAAEATTQAGLPVEPFNDSRIKQYANTKPDFEVDLLVQSMMNHGMGDSEPIEWEDSMPQMNQMMNEDMVRWIIRDTRTERENEELRYSVKVGEVKKIRINNLATSAHPMQHPMHLHGQRFVVLSIDGKQNTDLSWEDTIVVPAGTTVDLLVDFTNPGTWAFHCHIAEHAESGMMSFFEVDP